MDVRNFGSTGHAYDVCQCEDGLQVLVIPRERIVGLAYTWPVAITEEHGKLHGLNDPTDMLAARRVLTDTGLDERVFRLACVIARGYGWPLAPAWRDLESDMLAQDSKQDEPDGFDDD